MKISYNWLSDYLPNDTVTATIMEHPQRLSDILTSVGLEVENVEKFEEIKNSLQGLITGQVISCTKHPDADKLQVTTVDRGSGETLQIVCGAPNVAAGQKVIVAPPGTNLYTTPGKVIEIKKSKIRGAESNGMLCAEDEIGLGESHEGIIVLPDDTPIGISAFDYYKPYQDWVFEIGLTPNHMDAMSHLGVAKDVCAYLSHHNNIEIKVVSPLHKNFQPDEINKNITIEIKDSELCSRYAGVIISGITIAPSPVWLINKLKSIGLRPINNIVDITNFILHETGQPLHAFDADTIKGNKIIITTLADKTPFIALDEKLYKLSDEDIMICDGDKQPMCMAGVFGGLESGVTAGTRNIFLESAWFDPGHIRKTSLRHHLRTDAAIHFEKGVDISNAVSVLQRAALLIKEICGGKISSEAIDKYPIPKEQNKIVLPNNYLKKISGKNYDADAVQNILRSLNFSIIKQSADEIEVAAPFSNPDIKLPADVVEEIMRIDGLDNIEIPATVKMFAAADAGAAHAAIKEKVAGWLTANGFAEIFTNSITNSKYFDGQTLASAVKIINGISEGLDVMRPSMMPTGLESIAYNINRKNTNLLFFEFGKIYCIAKENNYEETESLALYFTGNKKDTDWQHKPVKTDIYFVKGICEAIFNMAGIIDVQFSTKQNEVLSENIVAFIRVSNLAEMGAIKKQELDKFSIKQPVYYLYINWQMLLSLCSKKDISFKEIARFPQVQRDLSIVINKSVSYQQLEKTIETLKIGRLSHFKLFDVFESAKLGAGKRSMAINFTFSDKEKTLTDTETDSMMNNIISALEKTFEAEIRSN